ncbi:hypothetical protein FVF58_50395 [Paraburkholderia panacisoli]|uniref:Dienelactone hydrolase domain-containing protein n=2 Tax=Paraburkholderia panacisoli TaxID=2603818 RepID=A0A5B0G0H4_9BURK|nr:hypothetical protein FVF58_50395 [Paraburkholderia panacisoli]
MTRSFPTAPTIDFNAARALTDSGSISELEFTMPCNETVVPGVLWKGRINSDRVPLILLQHGGSGHKQDEANRDLGTRLVSALGCLVAALDGPVHGSRAAAPSDAAATQAAFRESWTKGTHTESFVDEWTAAIDALVALPYVDAERVGWCGVSMGTAFGVPICAKCPVIRSAVLGKWSINQRGSQHLVAMAQEIRSSVLFVQHWDDEFFDRSGTHELFDALGTSDKRMYAYPGGHHHRTEEELNAYIHHFQRSLLIF